jgi:hypothetical protein
MKARHNLATSLALAMLVVCAVTAAIHESLYHVVQQGDVYAGRPFVDP